MRERKNSYGDFWVVALHVLALPVTLFLAVMKLVRTFRGYRLVSRSSLDCPHCGFSNPMNVLASCEECGTTEFGSRLYCTSCRAASRGFDCGGCRATIKVFP
jgi:hypothetical protein